MYDEMLSSVGEYAALVIAEVLSLQDSLRIVANRARYMARYCALNSSGMIAVGLQPSKVGAAIRSSEAFAGLSIACYNSPKDCVVSGPLDQLHAFKTFLEEFHCKNTLLSLPFGFHSSAMHPLLEDLDTLTRDISLRAPSIPVCSNVIGELVLPGDGSVFTEDYFSRHCLQPVLFEQGIQSLISHHALPKAEAWIEIGPHTTLLPNFHDHACFHDVLRLGSLRRNQHAWVTLTNSLSQLYRSEVHVKWSAVFSHLSSVSCVETPSYPFARTTFWVNYKEDASAPVAVAKPLPASPLLGTEYSMLHSCTQIPSPVNRNVAVFETPISFFASAIIGHKVGGIPLCPASVYLDQAFCGVNLARRHMGLLSSQSHALLKDLEFSRFLVHDENSDCVVKTIVTFNGVGSGTFCINSCSQGSEDIVIVRGQFYFQTDLDTRILSPALAFPTRRIAEILELESELSLNFSSSLIYDVVFPRVVEYAHQYRTIQTLRVDPATMDGVALVRLPGDHETGRFVVHPVFLDTFLHVAGFVANLQGDDSHAYICSDIGNVDVVPELIDNEATYRMFCHSPRLSEDGGVVANIYALDRREPARIVGYLEGVKFRRVRLDSLKRSLTHTVAEFAVSPGMDTGLSKFAIASRRLDVLDNVEVEVVKLVAETCEVDAASLGLQTNLRDLGVDSLMSIELSHKLQIILPHSPSSRDLLSCVTIADIVQIVEDQTSINSGTSTPSTLVHDHEECPVNWNAAISNKTSLDSSPDLDIPWTLVTSRLKATIHERFVSSLSSFPRSLQMSQSKHQAPLFLFHDGSGLIHYYESLLPLHRSVWGVHNPRLTAQPWDSVMQMAIYYAGSVRNIAPEGQVLLGGVFL